MQLPHAAHSERPDALFATNAESILCWGRLMSRISTRFGEYVENVGGQILLLCGMRIVLNMMKYFDRKLTHYLTKSQASYASGGTVSMSPSF